MTSDLRVEWPEAMNMQKILIRGFTERWNSQYKGPEAEWMFQDLPGGQNAKYLRGSQVRFTPKVWFGLGTEVLGVPSVGSWINTPSSHKIKED